MGRESRVERKVLANAASAMVTMMLMVLRRRGR